MAHIKIRLGTASPGAQTTTSETLQQLEKIACRAAEKNIDILLLPEAYIGGYPRGTAFGCLIGSRTNEGRDEYLRYFQSAVDLGDIVGDGAGAGDAWVRRELEGDAVASVIPPPGSSSSSSKPVENKRGDGTREELERIAKETGVFLVVGCIEKTGGSMYCSAVYVCPTMGIIGKRRKVMPTGTERLVWAQGSPATLRAVSTTIRGVRINMAAAICWENYMPLLRQALYAQNINLYLAPTADGRDTWLSLLRTIGVEGRCFVVSSNMCVREKKDKESNGATTPVIHHEPVFADDDGQEKRGRSPEQQQEQETTTTNRRRASCVTEDGFEIALPSPATTQRHHHSKTSTGSKRRKSVFDEDGNEIVLCRSKDEEDEDKAEGTSPTKLSSPVRTWARAAAVARARVDGHHHNGHTNDAKKKTTTAATKEKGGFVSRGGSSIVSPFGDLLAGPQWEDDNGIIYVDVDFDDCIRGRLDLDAAGSYSRNDSFKFSVQGLDLLPLPY
ncbi:carbon-nitrogen hydrolase [Apodospora peruviana]|uniref:Carbon-nitrogen hydrolase n=1 Tax=Apodospora peruviana TaxID=516989 RepID=A0AAE0HYY0_9PEZI|nr:carbon-nitrogen hydrolase [Apodospora peruviana]